MNKLDTQYQDLLRYILGTRTGKKDRTGTGTLSIFGYQFRHNMNDGFPLLTTKKMAIKSIMTELKWFLKGDTNIKYLVDNGCNIWNGDAYKKYVTKVNMQPGVPMGDILSQKEFIEQIKTDNEFAAKWGELGPIYGAQWRMWENEIVTYPGTNYKREPIDQIQNLINELKTNPDSRRLMVNAWNVGEIDIMTLPPCHYGFQVYTRELSEMERYWLLLKSGYEGKEMNTSNMMQICDDANVPKRAISLMWNQRSVDTFLGLPFNIASYAALLCLIAEEVDMIPDQLIGNLGDVHLYKNHVDQAREQVSREMYDLPTIEFTNVNLLDGEFDYEVKDYKYHPTIKAPLSN